jgi:kinesin family member 5
MQGVIDNLELEGIIPRMIRHIFDHILNSSADLEFTVKVSMIEIYQEKIKDLVDVTRTNLNVREDKTKGLYIEDLSEHYVACEEEVLEIMRIGSDNRSIGATNMNEHSSRSHSIFIMTIHQNNIKDLSAKTGKLYLVDLAGSEKISKTGATGLTLEEAKTINKSLTTLGMVINSLTDGKSSHVPYRESKLTRVLQESLGGNSKTCLIITCSPSVYNDAETLSTLRFGLRAKKIKNKPKINKEVTVAELKIEIEKLEDLLDKANKRIRQLENFIKNNNLTLPKEEEIINIISNIEENLENQEIEKVKAAGNLNLEIDEENITNDDKLKKQIVYVKLPNQKNTTPKFRHTIGFGLLTEQLKHERDYNKFQEKKIENLICDKKNLNEKLEETLESLNNCPIEIESKEELINKITLIRESYENNEKELISKIESLEKLLEDEKRNHGNNYFKNTISPTQQEDRLQVEDEFNISRRTIKIDEQTMLRHMTDEGEGYENFYNTSPSPLKKEHELPQKTNLLNEFLSKIEQSLSNTSELSNIISEYKSKIIDLPLNTNSQNLETALSANKNIQEEYKQEFEVILEEERRKYENEKKVIMKALEEKSEKLCQTEVENKDILEKLKNLETKISPEDKPNVKKILILEKNLEQLNKMFQHAMAQKSTVIIDKEVF